MRDTQLPIVPDLNSELRAVGKNWTCIGFVLDRSGSMHLMGNEARQGYNAFLEGQAKGPDLAALTTLLFDHEFLLHETFKDVRRAAPLDELSYQPRGTTALLDAMGRMIDLIGDGLDQMHEEEKPRRVIIVTLTDGEENASQHFTRDQIKRMIKHQRDFYSWEFLFLGAGLDSITVAQSYGIPATHAAVMHAGGQGLNTGLNSLNQTVGAYRASAQNYTSHLAQNQQWGGNLGGKLADEADKE